MSGELLAAPALLHLSNIDVIDGIDLQLIPPPPAMCGRIYKSVPGDGTSLQEQMCMEDCSGIFSDILASSSRLSIIGSY